MKTQSDRNSVLRTVSLVLIQTFFIQQVSYAAPEFRPAQINLFEKPATHLRFPDSVATIDDVYHAPGALKTLYLFQDAHTNESGQLNLSRALEMLVQKEKVKLIFAEAASGDNSLAFLRPYGAVDHRQQVAASYLRKGILHGEEYLDLTTDLDISLWGVESAPLYVRTLEAYREVTVQRPRLERYLESVENAVEFLKPRIYNPSLAALDQIHEKYLKEDLSLTEYFAALFSEAAQRNVRTADLANLQALENLKKLEGQIDFKQAGTEHAQAVAALPAEARGELAEFSAGSAKSPSKLASGRHEDRRAFYALLSEKLGASVSRYPELAKYLAYLKASNQISFPALFQEQRTLEDRLFGSAAITEDEKNLLRASRNLRNLKKLFDLTMTPEDYGDYKRDGRGHRIEFLTGFLNRKLMDLKTGYEMAAFLEKGYDEAIRSAERFYELTYARDKAFVEQSLAKMSADGQTQAALITGGFHTPNLKSLLKARGVSFVVITPQVLAETDRARYERLLLNQTTLLPGKLAAAPALVTAAGNTSRTSRILAGMPGIGLMDDATGQLAAFSVARSLAPEAAAPMNLALAAARLSVQSDEILFPSLGIAVKLQKKVDDQDAGPVLAAIDVLYKTPSSKVYRPQRETLYVERPASESIEAFKKWMEADILSFASETTRAYTPDAFIREATRHLQSHGARLAVSVEAANVLAKFSAETAAKFLREAHQLNNLPFSKKQISIYQADPVRFERDIVALAKWVTNAYGARLVVSVPSWGKEDFLREAQHLHRFYKFETVSISGPLLSSKPEIFKLAEQVNRKRNATHPIIFHRWLREKLEDQKINKGLRPHYNASVTTNPNGTFSLNLDIAVQKPVIQVVKPETFAVQSAQAVALKIQQLQQNDPKKIVNFVLATGRTMEAFLDELSKQKNVDWKRVRIFHLDEYKGLEIGHPNSYNVYLKKHFLSKLPQITSDRIHYLSAHASNIEKYTELLEKTYGGADVLMAGIGRDGHIAFNEPGTSFAQGIHEVNLAQTTIDDNKADYPGITRNPKAYTLGPRNILNAKHVFMLANGKGKASIVKEALFDPISERVSASMLQIHPSVAVILDTDAASLLPGSRANGARLVKTMLNGAAMPNDNDSMTGKMLAGKLMPLYHYFSDPPNIVSRSIVEQLGQRDYYVFSTLLENAIDGDTRRIDNGEGYRRYLKQIRKIAALDDISRSTGEQIVDRISDGSRLVSSVPASKKAAEHAEAEPTGARLVADVRQKIVAEFEEGLRRRGIQLGNVQKSTLISNVADGAQSYRLPLFPYISVSTIAPLALLLVGHPDFPGVPDRVTEEDWAKVNAEKFLDLPTLNAIAKILKEKKIPLSPNRLLSNPEEAYQAFRITYEEPSQDADGAAVRATYGIEAAVESEDAGARLTLTQAQAAMADLAAIRFGLKEADKLYFIQMWQQYLERRAGTAEEKAMKLILDRQNPGPDENYILASMLTADEREELLGSFLYDKLAQEPLNAESAKNAVITVDSMDGGIGESLGRIEELRARALAAGIPIDQVQLSAKGTDLGFDVTVNGRSFYMSVAESKALQLVLLARSQKFTALKFQPLVNWQSRASYENLLDNTIFFFDQLDDSIPPHKKRTYRQAMTDEGIQILDMLEQADLPAIEESTGDVSLNEGVKRQPGGHGQWGFLFLYETYAHQPPQDGKNHIRVFYNGDNLNSRPDESIAGAMIRNRWPIVKLTRVARRIDKKGGKDGVVIENVDGVDVYVPAQMELADAKAAGQEKEFTGAGLPGGLGEAHHQPFNTNIFYINESELHDILTELVAIVGTETLYSIISPSLIPKAAKVGPDGNKYIPVDGAIGMAMHRLNAYFMTSTDPGVKNILAKRGLDRLLFFVDVKDFFTPLKTHSDMILQRSDFYSYDTDTFTLRETQPGADVPEIVVSSLGPDGKADSYWGDLKRWSDAFAGASLQRLKGLNMLGRFNLRDSDLIGEINLKDQSGAEIDLNADFYRQSYPQLFEEGTGRLVLSNVAIIVQPDKSLTIQAAGSRLVTANGAMTDAFIKDLAQRIVGSKDSQDVILSPENNVLYGGRRAGVLLIKPNVNYENGVIEEILRRIRQFGYSVAAVKSYTGSDPRMPERVRNHYRRVYDIAKQGRAVLSDGNVNRIHKLYNQVGVKKQAGSEQGTFEQKFGTKVEDTPFFGAIELVDKYGMSPAAVSALWMAAQNDKNRFHSNKIDGLNMIAHNLSVVPVQDRAVEGGKVFFLVNGYYFDLIGQFEKKDSKTVALWIQPAPGQAVAKWRDMRRRFLGSSDPAKAPAESLRSKMHHDASFRSTPADITQNGFHLSASGEAGPEGENWFGLIPKRTPKRPVRDAARLAVSSTALPTVTPEEYNDLVARYLRGELGVTATRVPAEKILKPSRKILAYSKNDNQAGRELLAAGKLAAVYMGGGTGGRMFGYEMREADRIRGLFQPFKDVAGLSPELRGMTAFEYLMRSNRWVGEQFGGKIPSWIFGSAKNQNTIKAHFDSNNLFGMAAEDVSYYSQGEVPRLYPTYEDLRAAYPKATEDQIAAWLAQNGPPGTPFYANPETQELSYKPMGHLDAVLSFVLSGEIYKAMDRGIEYLYFIDNTNLGGFVDPAIVDQMKKNNADFAFTFVRKLGNERVGSPVDIDGVTRVLEGSDFPPGFDQSGLPYTNSGYYVIGLRALAEIFGIKYERNATPLPQAELYKAIQRVTAKISPHVEIKDVLVEGGGTQKAAQFARLLLELGNTMRNVYLQIDRSDDTDINSDTTLAQFGRFANEDDLKRVQANLIRIAQERFFATLAGSRLASAARAQSVESVEAVSNNRKTQRGKVLQTLSAARGLLRSAGTDQEKLKRALVQAQAAQKMLKNSWAADGRARDLSQQANALVVLIESQIGFLSRKDGARLALQSDLGPLVEIDKTTLAIDEKRGSVEVPSRLMFLGDSTTVLRLMPEKTVVRTKGPIPKATLNYKVTFDGIDKDFGYVKIELDIIRGKAILNHWDSETAHSKALNDWQDVEFQDDLDEFFMLFQRPEYREWNLQNPILASGARLITASAFAGRVTRDFFVPLVRTRLQDFRSGPRKMAVLDEDEVLIAGLSVKPDGRLQVTPDNYTGEPVFVQIKRIESQEPGLVTAVASAPALMATDKMFERESIRRFEDLRAEAGNPTAPVSVAIDVSVFDASARAEYIDLMIAGAVQLRQSGIEKNFNLHFVGSESDAKLWKERLELFLEKYPKLAGTLNSIFGDAPDDAAVVKFLPEDLVVTPQKGVFHLRFSPFRNGAIFNPLSELLLAIGTGRLSYDTSVALTARYKLLYEHVARVVVERDGELISVLTGDAVIDVIRKLSIKPLAKALEGFMAWYKAKMATSVSA